MWFALLARLAAQLFHLLLYFVGVRWNTHCHRLQLVQLACWILWYIVIWSFAVHRASKVSYCSFDCLITHVMFLMLTICHVFVLLDTFVQHEAYQDLVAQTKVELLYADEDHHVSLVLCGVLVPNIAMQCMVSWCRLRMDRMWNMSFFWVVVPASLGIQLKLYSFLWDILRANVRIVRLREHLKLLARNAKNCWQQQPAPDTRSVWQLKQRYSQLNQHFAQINLCYGNSLLIIFLHYFFNFTFNAYWAAKNLLMSPANTIMIFLHFGILFNLGLLFTVICWHCQQSYNHSRQVGCLISKLVKPLADKRYNDLICDFLLQTLHQRFVVTARDFFSLNLHLLSSMCAAVVTYLFIMIEFMYEENSSTETKLKDMSEKW